MRKYDVHFTKVLGIIALTAAVLATIIFLIGIRTPQPVTVESGKIPLQIGGHPNGYALHSRSAIDIRAFGVEERDGEVFLVARGCDAFNGFECIALRKFRSTEPDCSAEWQGALRESVTGTFDLRGLYFRICTDPEEGEGYFELKYDPAVWSPS